MSQPLSFPLSQAEFDTKAETFLLEHGFPADTAFLMFYGQTIQDLYTKSSEVTEATLEAGIRGRQTYRLAFHMIENARKAFVAEQKAEKEQQSGSQETPGTAKVLELTSKS